jgi:hypothetical protein
MRIPPLSYAFIKGRVRLSWRDALWGYERQLIGWRGIVDLALDRAAHGANEASVIQLAGAGKEQAHQVGELLRSLAAPESVGGDSDSRDKWVYLVLAWLFENRAEFEDPLEEVERIYADFDYPPDVERFVAYMPPVEDYDPAQHSAEENEKRLIEAWRTYLGECERKFGSFREAGHNGS